MIFKSSSDDCAFCVQLFSRAELVFSPSVSAPREPEGDNRVEFIWVRRVKKHVVLGGPLIDIDII